ncbi:EamA family transporter RarD [Asticcacaulis tiandongensis]|uniref:EamA family transporter RarD n=1 Tax=Asticcacaulis tiandongensis TaxID=2565365 RepID=UPI0011289CC8|nr:EamA family transporter RarD [Asticcacaulis tiandongensis]
MSQPLLSAPASAPVSSPVLLAILCYAFWGFAPLTYLPLDHYGAGPLEIMAHRSVWALLCSGLLVWMTHQIPDVLRILSQPKVALTLCGSALLIALNWGVFVWAVTNKHMIESALGYYLNPLLNMAAGAVLFRERLDNFGKTAIGLAVIGVAIQAFALGHIPYISLTLALTFAAYGIIRKQLEVSALSGLFVECLFLAVPSVAFLLWFEGTGQGHFFGSPIHMFWFVLTGPVTVLPLFLFAYVARRLPLSTMGFIQFLAPTIAFCIGLALGEPFSVLRGVSFVFIWVGALVFAFGAWRRFRALRI